jgi:hypothetical protein
MTMKEFTMKQFTMLALLGGLATAPLVMAQGSAPSLNMALQAATQHGVTQFHSVEIEDDSQGGYEVEGWLSDGGYVELDIKADGSIGKQRTHEKRGEPAGLGLAELGQYAQAAMARGMVQIEAFEVDEDGTIEFEGLDQNGRELEADFRIGQDGALSTGGSY